MISHRTASQLSLLLLLFGSFGVIKSLLPLISGTIPNTIPLKQYFAEQQFAINQRLPLSAVTDENLAFLPGIGSKTATTIIRSRFKEVCTSAPQCQEYLETLPRIGPKTAQQLVEAFCRMSAKSSTRKSRCLPLSLPASPTDSINKKNK